MADLPPIKTRVHSIQSHAVPIGDPGLDSPLLSQYRYVEVHFNCVKTKSHSITPSTITDTASHHH